MAIDAYSQCPGGTGKKIKFCCPDFLPELEKIDRMIEGEQFAACLHHVQLLREHPENSERQCLLSYETMLLRATGQIEEAQVVATYFLEKFPSNQAALAESVILAAMKQDFSAAMTFLQRAYAEAKGSWSWRTFHATQMLVDAYLHEGQWLPARALLQFLLVVDRQNQKISQTVSEFLRSPSVPLLLKEDPRFPQPQDNHPWANQFGQALGPMMFGDWLTAEKNLTALVSEITDAPEIWRSLATLRGWLGDNQGCIEALRKYASFDIPQEDAVEAEATAMLLSENHLGDLTAVLSVTWTVKDVERLQEAILSNSHIKSIPFDPSALAHEDSPPPKTVCMIFDKPALESVEGISAQSMPLMLGQLFLFGRQTDRDARLELVGITAAELPQIKAMFKDIAGEWLDGEEKTAELTTTSATDDLLQPRWQPPMGLNPRQYHAMLVEYQKDAILNQWPDIKLGALDGLSPREAAANSHYKIKLPAVILVLQYYADIVRCSFDLNELRTQLGLPILQPIDPQQVKIGQLPLIRLDRIDAQKLSDDDLTPTFQRAVGYSYRRAVLKFGHEIINRPSFVGRGELSLAYMTLARMEDDLDQAIAYIEAGRNATEALGKSHAMWDLEELSLRFARQDIAEALQLIRHIESNHINEPNVAMVLTQILVEAGLLKPDGTPAMPAGAYAGEAAPGGAPEPEPGKLWTPDGESSGGGGGKLWTPD